MKLKILNHDKVRKNWEEAYRKAIRSDKKYSREYADDILEIGFLAVKDYVRNLKQNDLFLVRERNDLEVLHDNLKSESITDLHNTIKKGGRHSSHN